MSVVVVVGVVGRSAAVVGGQPGVAAWRGGRDGAMAEGADTPPEGRRSVVACSCPVAASGGAAQSSTSAAGAGPSSVDYGDPSLIRAHGCRPCCPDLNTRTKRSTWYLCTLSQVAACVAAPSGAATSSSSDSKRRPPPTNCSCSCSRNLQYSARWPCSA